MKKTTKKIVSLLLLLATLLATVGTLSGCSLGGVPIETGVSITDTRINADGELIVYYSDGTHKNLGLVVGKDGVDGEDNSLRVVSAEINEAGELILYYSDDTTENLGVVVGGGTDNETPPVVNNTNVTVEITGDAESVVAAVAAAAPSVVSVYCNFSSNSLFGSTSASVGSGVIYYLDKDKGDALIITNYHLVYNADLVKTADQIQVKVYGSPLSAQAIPATFVGGSMKEDIAVLHVQGSELLKTSIAKAATLASSDALYPGDTAIAIGNPQGKGISATYGKVNVPTESLETTACDDVTEISLRVIRIDTAVNAGNSGGGLFDAHGRLIGIVNVKIIEENIENIGFALPIDKVKALVDNIVDYCLLGEYITPYKPTLGITAQIVDSAAVLNEENGLIDIVETLEVIDVAAGSPADGCYQVGDRLISVTVGESTVAVTKMHHITEAALRLRPGQSMTVRVLRNGTEVDVVITPPTSAYNPC